MNRLHSAVIGLVLLCLCAPPVWGEGDRLLLSLATGTAREDGLSRLLPLLLKGVGLTPEQKQHVKRIIAARREPLALLFRQLEAANTDLARQFLVTGELRAEDLAPQVERIAQIREQLLWEGVKTLLEMRAVLTPEQRARAVRLTEQLRSWSGAVEGMLRGDEAETE
ncbi:MAG: Spy/CpxP family protein refolding chaperone [Thermodesulfobacteriota bacterium]